jgi:tRNA nucleotidyltransferase (CCA-adding enzyme)
MKTYLVGGAVRDELLGRAVHDLDYVVVGSTIDQMKAEGFMQVGADFPVFLHPQTKDEYALARTERKSGVGYKGFSVDFNASVTLEEDLMRRDLTINAIAKADNGEFVDPHDGQLDLKNRVLRHVSIAFVEDPLRVLRVARFAAQLNSLGFSVHQDTQDLMNELAVSGELAHLTPERVFKETEKALNAQNPAVYFTVLQKTGALAVLFPELEALIGAHREDGSDAFVHAIMALQQATRLSDSPEVRWAALFNNLGKGITPQAVNERLKVPTRFAILAEKVSLLHLTMHQMLVLQPAQILKLLEMLDVFRKPSMLEHFILACEADARAVRGAECIAYLEADFLRQAYKVSAGVIANPFVEQGYKGIEIKEMIQQARINAIGDIVR